MTTNPCPYCGAKSGQPCSGYGLVDGDIHEARQHGATKAANVVEMGRARALLGCSSSMSLLDGVRQASARLTEQMSEIERIRSQRDDLMAACELWLSAESPQSTTNAYEMAARAIAKAKGQL